MPFSAIHFLRPLALLAGLMFAGRILAAPIGQTIRLDYGHGSPQTNHISQFMYFVPLIAFEPVTMVTNSGNRQGIRILSFASRTNGSSYQAACEFAFIGAGSLQNIFDHTELIQRRLPKLQAGEAIPRHLSGITVEGVGLGTVEISGVMTNHLPLVNVVQMRFNAHGQSSPVTALLQDIAWRNGTVTNENALVARVNSLTFRRDHERPKMEISMDSVKRQTAGNGLWQRFVGGLKGGVANLFIPPLPIDAEGQRAMLDFGQALAGQQPEFTFPFATRLKTITSSPAN